MAATSNLKSYASVLKFQLKAFSVLGAPSASWLPSSRLRLGGNCREPPSKIPDEELWNHNFSSHIHVLLIRWVQLEPRPQLYGHFYSIMKQIGQVEASWLILVSSFWDQLREAECRCTFSRPGAPSTLICCWNACSIHATSEKGLFHPSGGIPNSIRVIIIIIKKKIKKIIIIKCCPWTRGRAANWPTNRMQVFRVGLPIETGN